MPYFKPYPPIHRYDRNCVVRVTVRMTDTRHSTHAYTDKSPEMLDGFTLKGKKIENMIHQSTRHANASAIYGTPARFFHFRVKWHVQRPTLYAVFSASTPCMSSISH